MNNRGIRKYKGRRSESRLRRIRVRYMRRMCERAVRTRRLAFFFCTALATGYLLILARQSGRLFQIKDEKIIETQVEEKQENGSPEKEKQQFGIVFRLKNGEIILYREGSY